MSELQHNNDQLLKVEMAFYDDVFNSEEDYQSIYTRFLNKWNEEVDKLGANNRLKYTGVNAHLFEKFFKPIEKPFELSFRFAYPELKIGLDGT